MEFGVLLPQFAGATWEKISSTARTAEDAGFDSLWFVDHVYGFPPEGGILEPWTLLSALAPVTRTVGLGAQVFCQSFRSPALMAKMASTLQIVSDGRLHFLIGAGWYEDEYRAFGYEFPPARTRFEQLRDTVRICRGMWESLGAPFTYEGTHYAVDGVVNLPPPSSPISLGVGGVGDRVLDLIASDCDEWNCPASSLHEYPQRKAVLEGRLAKYGRDVRRTQQVVFSPGDGDPPAALQLFNPQLGLVGSVEQMCDRVGQFAEAGVTGLFGMPARRASLDLIAEALPELRKAAG
jgi:alkanesulfonate monooxygenase SsuD/methylene tetrahydromethanopterin reductase-like flavin-dependent oxidoreductase (luciferase family)